MNKIIAFATVAAFAFLSCIVFAHSQTMPTPPGQEPMVCTSGLSKLQGQELIKNNVGSPPYRTYKTAEARTFVKAVNRAYEIVTGKAADGEDIEADQIDVYAHNGGFVVVAYFGGCTQAMARFTNEQMALIMELKNDQT